MQMRLAVAALCCILIAHPTFAANSSTSSNSTAGTTGGCGSGSAWRASDLQTCRILNGYEVDSKFVTKVFDMSVKETMDTTAIIDSKEEYDKCKAKPANADGSKDACYANTPACKQAGHDFYCIMFSTLCGADKAVETSGKPCHELCIRQQLACLPYDASISHSMAELVCDLLGPDKDEKCFGDAGFSGMKPSAVKDPEGTKYEKLVEMALALPMTADAFTAKKKLFEQAIAAAGNVNVDKVEATIAMDGRRHFEAHATHVDVEVQADAQVYAAEMLSVLNRMRIVADLPFQSSKAADSPRLHEGASGAPRRLLAADLRVNVKIKARDDADAKAIISGLTAENINEQLARQGLPAATIVEEPKISSSQSLSNASRARMLLITPAIITIVTSFASRMGT